MAPQGRNVTYCPSCGTQNHDNAAFCKHCGFNLLRAPRPAAAVPAPQPPPRPWWHGFGVFLIIAAFLFLIDFAGTRRLTWSLIAVLAVAFLLGGITILQWLASSDRRDPRPLVVGGALLLASVILIPAVFVFAASATTQETFIEPMRAGIESLSLQVHAETGQVTVTFAQQAVLARVVVTHIGGPFATHSAGDVTMSNASVGRTLTLAVEARGAAFFFGGGHDIAVTVNPTVSVTIEASTVTGDVDLSIPGGVVVEAGGISATATTGSITVEATDAAFVDGAVVRAQTTTGSVTLRVTQAIPYDGTVAVRGETTTGSLTFTFAHGADVGARVVSSVTTGSINADPSKYSGTSNGLLYAPSQAAYDAAGMKFSVDLRTTTGSISLG